MTDLEGSLRAAGDRVDWPEADLTGRVTSQITAERPRGAVRWVQVALAASAVAFLVLATPVGRQAVADLLEVAGIRVGWGIETGPPGVGLDLGQRVSVEEAADLSSFPILVPGDTLVGEADAVYHSHFPPGGAVHFVWEAAAALPAAGDSGVGLLYSQFRLEPGGFFIKSLETEVEARPITIRGGVGFWVEGAPHIIFYEDENGSQERVRLAANVLAWEEDGVTHRIETTLGLEQVLDIADSLRPMP